MPSISIVVPIYRPGAELARTISELVALSKKDSLLARQGLIISEILLVTDGPQADHSLNDLLREWPDDIVRAIRLTRNFGQHAATIAGILSSSGDWIVTMDEDGAHPPEAIQELWRAAKDSGVLRVYGVPQTGSSHGILRRTLSAAAKIVTKLLSGDTAVTKFQSFRLIKGDVARNVLAVVSRGVYLDVALSWVMDSTEFVTVRYRGQRGRTSAYNMPKLVQHFFDLVFSSSTRILRVYGLLGIFIFIASSVFGLSLFALWSREVIFPSGWLVLAISGFFAGLVLTGIAVLAEYIARIVDFSSGRPLFLISDSRFFPGRS